MTPLQRSLIVVAPDPHALFCMGVGTNAQFLTDLTGNVNYRGPRTRNDHRDPEGAHWLSPSRTAAAPTSFWMYTRGFNLVQFRPPRLSATHSRAFGSPSLWTTRTGLEPRSASRAGVVATIGRGLPLGVQPGSTLAATTTVTRQARRPRGTADWCSSLDLPTDRQSEWPT